MTHEALLVIDVQNEYFTGKLPVTYPFRSFENILLAMDAADDFHIPVVVVQHSSTSPDAPTFRKGTREWELHEKIRERPYHLLLEKTLPGSFTGTRLSPWLKKHGITTLSIAGYMTQMCCDTTARQAFHRGYSVKFLADATGTLSVTNSAGTIIDSELHRAILVTQQMRFSRVMTTSEWIREI